MAIQQDWKISRRANKCSHSDIEFADGEDFYTCIFDDPESEGFLRKDFSEEAWNELSDTLQPFSFWKSTCKYPPDESQPEVLESESAETMLRRLIEEDDPSSEKARYILALMLERKKALRPVGVKETESNRLLLYDHRTTGDVIVVLDPQLKLDEVEKIQMEVSQLLGSNNSNGVEKAASQEESNDERPTANITDSSEESDASLDPGEAEGEEKTNSPQD